MLNKVRKVDAILRKDAAPMVEARNRRFAVVSELVNVDKKEEPEEDKLAKTSAGHLLHAQQQFLANEKGKHVLLHSSIYLCFVLLYSLTIAFSQAGGEPSFELREQYDNMVLGSNLPNSPETFFTLTTPNEVWVWLQYNFANNVFPDTMRSDNTIWIGFNKLLGTVRLRQLRVKPNSCDISPDQANSIKFCYAGYSAADEDSTAYGPGSKWTWANAKTLSAPEMDMPYWAKFQKYPGSGYVVDLYGSKNATYATIAYLHENNWIDAQTRFLYISTTLYNPALHVFLMSDIAFEFLPSGGVLPSKTTHILKMDRYGASKDKVFLVNEFLLIMFVIWYLVEQIRAMKAEGLKVFFANLVSVLDFANILLFLIGIALRVTTLLMWKRLNHGAVGTYVNYASISNIMQQELNWNAVNAILCFGKIFRYMKAIPTVKVLLDTIAYSLLSMRFFMIIFLLAMCSFTFSGYIAFGIDLEDFRTLPQVFFSLMRGINGVLAFDDLYNSNRVFGPIYYFTFYIIVFYVLMNMFLAVISIAYDMAQGQKQKGEYSIDFLVKPIAKFVKGMRKSCCGLEDSDGDGDVPKTLVPEKRSEGVPNIMETARKALIKKRPGLSSQLKAEIRQATIEFNRSELAFVDELLTSSLAEIEERMLMNVSNEALERIDDRLQQLEDIFEESRTGKRVNRKAQAADAAAAANSNNNNNNNKTKPNATPPLSTPRDPDWGFKDGSALRTSANLDDGRAWPSLRDQARKYNRAAGTRKKKNNDTVDDAAAAGVKKWPKVHRRIQSSGLSDNSDIEMATTDMSQDETNPKN